METLRSKKITIENLKKLDPCESGYKFAQSKKTLIEAWNTCKRGDLLLWFASKLDCPVGLLTLAKAKCAETVINLMKDERCSNAVKVAIDFGNGVATREELDAAAAAAADAAEEAYDYAFAAYAVAASNAAAAAYAAAATDITADTAADASADAAAAVYTDTADADEDAYASADAAKKENQQQTADICREILTDFIKSKI